MQPIDADYDEGVLRPTKPLHLKQGERVALLVVRRADPRRWDMARLSRTCGPEDQALAQEGLGDWANALDEWKQH